MRFIEVINRKKFALVSIFLFLYVIFNLFEGERGIISYYEKQKIKKQLIQEKNFLTTQLDFFEKKIELLTNKIDLDYLEILYREKFLAGKENEKIYVNKNETETSRKN
tara:strand:+ start:2322 stop:2645 length:324 start_codon:yes stop_codon:yes gene_type:complete